jgi:endonuclease III
MAKAAANAPTGDLAVDLLRVCEALEVRYGRRKQPPHGDVIEALAFQILELGVPEKTARQALDRLREEFIDWNDMRVATIREIEDVLGVRYPKVREKAEDIRHLLADLYTAFRRMDVTNALQQGDGIETLRALPETSNIRRDFVERALLLSLGLKLFPCDEDQLRLAKFLGGVPKPWTLQQAVKRIEETLEAEDLARVSRVLREHVHLCQEAGEDEPQIIAYKWDQPDPLGMDKPAKGTSKVERPTAKVEKKPATAKVEKGTSKVEKPAAKPEKKAEKPAAKPGKGGADKKK